MSPSDFTGIVLAGGKSSRMGREKGLISYRGMTLVERAANILAPFCKEVVLSTNQQDFNSLPYRKIPDLQQDKGPMMGLYSCMMACSGTNFFVLPADNVFVTSEFFSFVLDKLKNELAAIPWFEGNLLEPLIGYYHRDMLIPMEKHMVQGKYKLPDLLAECHILKLDVASGFELFTRNYFRSINHPDDLVLLQE